jgi:hypothetical protein
VPAPFCSLWPARLYIVFPHYLINGTIFEKKRGGGVIEHETSVSSFTATSSVTFLIERGTERDMITNVHWACQFT